MNTVLCLHASASGGRQWRRLGNALGDRYEVLAPNLTGYGNEAFSNPRRFSLDHEVDEVLRQIGGSGEPMHIIGHSYGGAVGLRFASRYPERVASLTLYEPAQWLLLFEDGIDSEEAREIRGMREVILQHSRSIFSRWFAAREFINYWSGPVAWRGMRHYHRRRSVALIPKIAAECDALFSAAASIGNGTQFTMPVQILCGSRTNVTARRAAELLAEKIDHAVLQFVDGVAHMAPVTHPGIINPLIADHVQALDSNRRRTAA